MSANKIGMVLDIHRFSLHDGPGIRTTIFLKGCPLSCKWCHNPESQSYKPQLSFDSEKCTNCFYCIPACPKGVFSHADGVLKVNFSSCDGYGDCVSVCPTDALKVYGRMRTADEVMSVVLKDISYYNRSGGGLTISGGEPMARFEFTRELLSMAKNHGIHTCIETCGHAPTEKFSKIIDLVDLFLFDYKETDPAGHKKITGVSNRLILQNLEFLYSRNANIILRCPIIPGLNDTKEHLSGIYGLQTKYPKLAGIELLPYHNMGRSKAENIGVKYELSDTVTSTQDQISSWLDMLNEIGCEEIRVG